MKEIEKGKKIEKYDIQMQARKLSRRYPNFQASDVWIKKFMQRANI